MKKIKPIIVVLICKSALGGMLGNPSVTIPDARVAVGASYYIGGNTITNKNVLSMLNRVEGAISYAPFKFVNFGVGLGATQMDVDHYGSGRDSVPIFHGEFGFSGNAHIKLATPYFLNDFFCITAIGQGGIFKSKNRYGAEYGAREGSAMAGLQVHIKNFGYISAGPQLCIIDGSNKSYQGKKGTYSNSNNIRGWASIDFFPKVNTLSSNKPYISLEFTASPEANYSKNIPVQEFSVAVSIGSISKRLYGITSELQWEP